jgi:hypothetical protein
VEAVISGSNINITWEAPIQGTPTGYNIYRDGNKLNGTTQLTNLSFTETNVTEGVCAYNVTAVYEGNKESFAEMSNVICYFLGCEKPENLSGTVDVKTATISWNPPVNMNGFLGYNIYRNETKINEQPVNVTEYSEELYVGKYTYQVSAVFEQICQESDFTDEVTLIVCEAPANLQGNVEDNAILLTWTEPENVNGTLSGYNIYRNDAQINVEVITETEYLDEVLAGGNYSYQVSAVFEHCEQATEEMLINVGVNEFKTSSYNIFPNPTNGEFRISSSEFRIDNIAIYDVYGKCVLKPETQNSKQETIINVSHLQAGIYLVKIYSDNNITVTKRLVIIK